MFYRWRESEDVLVATDLGGAYCDETLFIIGGHPSINDQPLELLNLPGVMTMALNNVPYTFRRPTFWLTADKPNCYGGHFYHRADMIKLARSDTMLDVPNNADRQLRSFPNTLFYELKPDKYEPENFFSEGNDFVWWKSVFPLALQMAWRLGFRRIYLVGCAFWSTVIKPYAWGTQLSMSNHRYTQTTYDEDITKLRKLSPYFDAAALEVISCTPGSRANEVLRYTPLADAVAQVLKGMPEPTPLEELKHSSANEVKPEA